MEVLNPYAFLGKTHFEQEICKNILSNSKTVTIPYIWLFLSSSRLILPHFLFSLIFKFPCTMREKHQDLPHWDNPPHWLQYHVGDSHNIYRKYLWAVRSAYPEKSGRIWILVSSNSVYCSGSGRNFFFPESGGIFFKLFFWARCPENLGYQDCYSSGRISWIDSSYLYR